MENALQREKKITALGWRALWSLPLTSQGNNATLRSTLALAPISWSTQEISKAKTLYFFCNHSLSSSYHAQSTMPAYKPQARNTEQPQMLKKKQHETTTCKISDCYFTLIWGFLLFFFLVWEIDPQLARTQPNSCIASLLPPTLQKLARALFVLANAQGFIIMYY